VRLALSKQAAAFLTEGRVRTLVNLELPSTTRLAEEPTGPLDENSIHLYVDLPEPSVVTIQVQAPQRKVQTRRVDVAGLAWDVAARVTAIAASEAVRSVLEPEHPRPTKPREPTDEELATTFRKTPSIGVTGSFGGAVLPSIAALGGSRLAVSFHQPFFTEELTLTALGGDGPAGRLRWLELGVTAGYRLYFSSRIRSDLGASFGVAHASLRPNDPTMGGDDFTVRVAAHLTFDVRVLDRTWLTFQIEPGGILVDAPTSVRGAWFGANLGVAFDTLLPGAPDPPKATNGPP
jgi:hypothetical protein